jgi:hypothetical protein
VPQQQGFGRDVGSAEIGGFIGAVAVSKRLQLLKAREKERRETEEVRKREEKGRRVKQEGWAKARAEREGIFAQLKAAGCAIMAKEQEEDALLYDRKEAALLNEDYAREKDGTWSGSDNKKGPNRLESHQPREQARCSLQTLAKDKRSEGQVRRSKRASRHRTGVSFLRPEARNATILSRWGNPLHDSQPFSRFVTIRSTHHRLPTNDYKA